MQLTVDLESDVPVYRQIVSGLRRVLVAGQIAPGASLPTVRGLAFDLGVHHNTVAQAYRVLAQEGWLELRRGRGAIAVERATPRASAATKQALLTRLRHVLAEASAGGVSPASLRRALAQVAREFAEES